MKMSSKYESEEMDEYQRKMLKKFGSHNYERKSRGEKRRAINNKKDRIR